MGLASLAFALILLGGVIVMRTQSPEADTDS
jgi:hypothetical protein